MRIFNRDCFLSGDLWIDWQWLLKRWLCQKRMVLKETRNLSGKVRSRPSYYWCRCGMSRKRFAY